MDYDNALYIARTRVERGVKLLDEKLPNWRQHVDVNTLDITSTDHCVGAQIGAGEWGRGFFSFLDNLELSNTQAADCGFDFFCQDADPLEDLVEEEWKKAINS